MEKKEQSTSWHTYPKIYAMGHAAVKDIFTSEVVIQEKVDGSQFSFGLFDGEVKCRSRGKMQDFAVPDSLFVEAMNAITVVKDLLVDGWTYRGEYLSKPKHNVICYDRTPTLNIILFDINDGEESYLEPRVVAQEAKRLGFESVPLIFEGVVSKDILEDICGWLERESLLGGHTIEGVVIKNYSLFGRDKKALMAKFVSSVFKEKHDKTWGKKIKSGKDIVGMVTAMYATENRWQKALQHLRESGQIYGEPKDIGALVKEVQADVMSECAEEIGAMLLRHFNTPISRGLIKGLPEWYKRILAESVNAD